MRFAASTFPKLAMNAPYTENPAPRNLPYYQWAMNSD